MIIKVLGSGCKKCHQLEDNTKLALEKSDISASIEKVTDFIEITKYGVMQTPALVIDEKVVSTGKVLSVNDIIDVLSKWKK